MPSSAVSPIPPHAAGRYEHAAADFRARMNLDAGEKNARRGDTKRASQRILMRPQPVRQTMDLERVKNRGLAVQ